MLPKVLQNLNTVFIFSLVTNRHMVVSPTKLRQFLDVTRLFSNHSINLNILKHKKNI